MTEKSSLQFLRAKSNILKLSNHAAKNRAKMCDSKDYGKKCASSINDYFNH